MSHEATMYLTLLWLSHTSIPEAVCGKNQERYQALLDKIDAELDFHCGPAIDPVHFNRRNAAVVNVKASDNPYDPRACGGLSHWRLIEMRRWAEKGKDFHYFLWSMNVTWATERQRNYYFYRAICQ